MNEPIALLISGVCRSFEENLWKQLQQLPDYYNIYISFPVSDKTDRFLNRKISIDKLTGDSHIKQIFIDSEEAPTDKSKNCREYNIIQQWYRFKKLFSLVPTTYTTYIRCRPDLLLECSIQHFCSLVEQHCAPATIYIPKGFDICDPALLSPTQPIEQCINDQFAIGPYDIMNQYSKLYDYILSVLPTSLLLSEHLLFQYLTLSNITPVRIDLPYRLILSQCFSISICGDSGSGKSTVSALLQEILPFDNTLLFETDRYHKWERGSQNYQTHTHLSPEANYLEKMADDAYTLSIGQTVVAVDYDHTTGKFTAPNSVEPKPYMILCGLHTLYKENLRAIMDLTIYIDTDEDLKRFWKLTRDTGHRGKTSEQVLASIEARVPDYRTYILPQREYADIIVRYKPLAPDTYDSIGLEVHVCTALVQEYSLTEKLAPFILSSTAGSRRTVYEFKSASTEELTRCIDSHGYNLKTLRSGYDGLLQFLTLCIIWRT
jgi:uridine kinase